MDYGAIISRAFNIVWQHKWLIILGFLVALGSGGNGSPNFNANFDSTGVGGDQFQWPPEQTDPEEFFEDFDMSGEELAALIGVGVPILIALLCVGLVIGLVLWVVSRIATGALIAGVDEIERTGTSSFAQAFRAGWEKAGRLIGIGLVGLIPVLVSIGLVMGLVISLVGAGSTFDSADSIIGGAVVAVLCLTCVIALVMIVVSWLMNLADRAAMLEDKGVFEAYGRAWNVLTENFGQTLVVVILNVVIMFGLGIVLIIPTIMFTICCILIPLLWAINGAITAFFSAVWTLAYREWTGLTGGGEPVVVETAPAV